MELKKDKKKKRFELWKETKKDKSSWRGEIEVGFPKIHHYLIAFIITISHCPLVLSLKNYPFVTLLLYFFSLHLLVPAFFQTSNFKLQTSVFLSLTSYFLGYHSLVFSVCVWKKKYRNFDIKQLPLHLLTEGCLMESLIIWILCLSYNPQEELTGLRNSSSSAFR